MSILHRKYIPIVVAILAFVFVVCISLFFFVCIKHRPIESALFPLFFISVFTFSILAISLSLFSIISRWRNKSCTRFQFVRICKDMPNSWNLGVLLFCIVVFSWLVFLACVFFYDRENLYDWFHSVLFPLPVTLLPFFLTIILCRFSISYCKNKFVQPIRTDGPASHMAKYNTPIFGGVAFVLSCLITYALTYRGFYSTTDGAILNVMCVVVLVSFALIGFIDDILKITKKSSNGMSGKLRFCLECLISIVVYLQVKDVINSVVNIPYIGQVDFGIFFIPWFVFIITGTANAVNLTDGLDGLVTVPAVLILMSFGTIYFLFDILYIFGILNYDTFKILNYAISVRDVGFALLMTIPLIFSCLGFLTLNTKPAKIFMGDTGSLALGGAIGYTALVLKCEFALAFIGLIFVLETLSVIIQVVSFKLRKKRVFKMAPLHHHFELLGWSETKIVLSAWTISSILLLIYVILRFYNHL